MPVEDEALAFFSDVYEVWPVSGAAWKDHLERHLNRRYGTRLGGNSRPFHAVLAIAEANGCRTVVIEREYFDEDYLDEYVHFYCRTFRPHRQRCVRLHFFAAELATADLTNLAPLAEGYLGFTIVRPISAFATGRTIVRPPDNPSEETYVLSRARFDVNLAGNPLSVVGAPFMQQDTNVGACAQADLWMMALFMHAAYRYPRFHPAEISLAATRFLPSSGGRDGLHVDQIREAIRSMGYIPHFQRKVENATTKEPSNLREMSKFIYAYMESEIPVLLALRTADGGHTVATVGHTYRLQPTQLPSQISPDQLLEFEGKQLPYRTSSEWVSNFIINNDAVGPYQSLANEEDELANIDCAIATTPPEVSLTPSDAEHHSLAFISGGLNSLFPDAPLSPADLSDLVFRPSLIRSNKFKERLATSQIHEAVRRLYRGAPLPRFIWLVEISTPSLVSHPNPKSRKMLGEILIDATANPFDLGMAVVSFHFCGRVFAVFSGKFVTMTIPDDHEYAHAVRAHGSVP